MAVGLARLLQVLGWGATLVPDRKQARKGERKGDVAKGKAKPEGESKTKTEEKGNGQKGKSRLEIAQEAHEKAVAKAAATEARLEKAKRAGSLATEKKREAATKAFFRALDQLHNCGLLDDRGNDALFETFQVACPNAPLDE